jgi:uncharacterized protein (DUF433 family)
MRLSHEERALRREAIRSEVAAGATTAEVAAKYRLTREYVQRIALGVSRPRRAPADLTQRREAALRELHSLQISQANSARLLSMSTPGICVMARRLGLTFSKAWQRVVNEQEAVNKARVVTMAALYRGGYTLEQIGAQYGITRERVRQLLTKHYGIRHEDGGQHQRVEKARQLREAKRDGKYLKKYGCTFAQWQELRDIGAAMMAAGHGRYQTPLAAYRTQERNAKTRGIAWNFTMWQWWQVWQASGRWEQRGRGNGYMMCRIGDQGAYEPGNVFIATGCENSSEGNRKKDLELPIGVRRVKSGRYFAQRRINGVLMRLGTHDTPELAYAAYLMAGQTEARAA